MGRSGLHHMRSIVERHPLIFLAVVVVLGGMTGTIIGLLLRMQRVLDQLVEVTRGVMSNLADLVEKD